MIEPQWTVLIVSATNTVCLLRDFIQEQMEADVEDLQKTSQGGWGVL